MRIDRDRKGWMEIDGKRRMRIEGDERMTNRTRVDLTLTHFTVVRVLDESKGAPERTVPVLWTLLHHLVNWP